MLRQGVEAEPPRHGGGLFPVQVQAQGRQPPLQVPEARLQLMGQGRPCLRQDDLAVAFLGHQVLFRQDSQHPGDGGAGHLEDPGHLGGADRRLSLGQLANGQQIPQMRLAQFMKWNASFRPVGPGFRSSGMTGISAVASAAGPAVAAAGAAALSVTPVVDALAYDGRKDHQDDEGRDDSGCVHWLLPFLFQGGAASGGIHRADGQPLVLVLVLTEQQVHNDHNQDHGHHSADAEGDLAGDEAADLIDNQGDHIGEHAHIADGKGGPTWRCSSPA